MSKENTLKEVAIPIKPVAILSSPSGERPTNITEEDVWGKWDQSKTTKIDRGMVKARMGEKCPYFGDILEYKNVTVVCNKEDFEKVVYWLEYVYGANCVVRTLELEKDKIVIRSSYTAE